MRKQEVKHFLQKITSQMGNKVLTHKFLYVPEFPLPLMGQDLLKKLGTLITSDKKKVWVRTLQAQVDYIL